MPSSRGSSQPKNQTWVSWIADSLLLSHQGSPGVQFLSRLFATLWTAVRQAFLSFTISRSLLKPKCTESVMPPNHLVLYHPLVLLPSIFPSIRVFSNESVLHIQWPKYWSFSLSISPSSEYSGLTSFRIDSEKAMTPHSTTLAWKIPWTKEPGRLRSMGL